MVLAAELIAGVAVTASSGRSDRPKAVSAGAPAAVVAAGRTVRLVDLGGSGSRSLLNRVAAEIGPAVDAVDGFWGTDWPRTITVLATGSDSQFRTEAGGGPPAQWADIAAVAVADQVEPARHVVVNQRIVFAPGAVRMSESSLRIVLRHELFHYAARADTALDAPRWLTEGVADFVARPRTALPAVSQLPDALPSDADLDTPGPQRSLAYDRAWWFARFVADSLRRRHPAPALPGRVRDGRTGMSVAVQEVLGADTGEVVARWRRWLAR